MATRVIPIEAVRTESRLHAKALLVWLLPLLYPLCYPGINQGIEWVRSGAQTGILLFGFSLGWALAGPWAAWLTLNYLDQNGLERRQYRVVLYGTLLTTINPPFYNFVGNVLAQFNHAALRLPVWYSINAIVAASAFIPAQEESKIIPDRFRRVHGYTAMLIVVFAVAHVFNHSLALISMDANGAVMRVLRLVYRERLIEIALVSAVVAQALTGLTMVWKSRFRRATSFRNLQIVSGLFMAAFFLSHLRGTFSARLRLVDTTFGWATNAPAGLLAKPGSVGLLPYYVLAVAMLFVHLGCQARWNLARILPETAARKISYGLMAAGGVAAFAIALAACGIHLVH